VQTYDISLTISPEMVVWPDDPPVSLERVSKIEDGDVANVTRMELSVHTGTHVDAPFHFLRKGTTVETLDLSVLVGRAYVLEVGDNVTDIGVEHLQNSSIPPRTKRVLFKTRNSSHWTKRSHKNFDKKYVAVSPEGAQYLVERGVKLVGVDYLSVAPFNDVTPTHEILLEAGVVIVEGLNLSEVSQGRYNFYCLPLKIAGADGAPARAILVGV
jgi:arylformamidase